jgi:hypothetical protein
MRRKLANIEEERKRFSGAFVRYGKKAGFRGKTQETILLRDIRSVTDGQIITDHLWFNLTKEFAALQLSEGDVVEFDARAKSYVKGYVNRLGKIDNRKQDYKLSHPTKVEKV